VGIRNIESLQRWKRRGAATEHIEATAIFLVTVVMLPRERRIARGRIEQETWRRRHHAGATQLWIEQPARGQRDIADNLSFHTEPRAARQQPVVRIAFVKLRCDSR